MRLRPTTPRAGRGGRATHRRPLEVALLEDRLLLASPDTTAPTTAAAIMGTLGNNGTYVSPVTINLTATDPDDDPSTLTTEFSVNGAPFQTGNTISLSNNGTDSIQFFSKDPAGNVEATQTLMVKIDQTAPTTTAMVTGRLGNNGFYTGPVTVHLSATDPDDSSSSLMTQFSINGGAFQTGNTINLTRDGIDTIRFRSMDPAGNAEATKTLIVKIDQTAPRLILMASPTSLWPPNGKLVTIHVVGLAADNLSGVASPLSFHVHDEYGLVQPRGMAPIAPNGMFSFTFRVVASRLGQDKDGRQYTLFVTVKDMAGNATTRSVVITVPHDQGKHNGAGKAGKKGAQAPVKASTGKGDADSVHNTPHVVAVQVPKNKHANQGNGKGGGKGHGKG